MLLGWIYWTDDGTFKAQKTFEEWCTEAGEDRLFGKILYNSEGQAREVQYADWYYVAPHGPSGQYTHGTCHDAQKAETERRYPGAVFKRGIWGPTDWWRELKNSALALKWDEIDWQQISVKQLQKPIAAP